MRLMIIAVLLFVSIADGLYAKPSIVKIVRTGDGFTLQCNGRPYFIQGAAGDAPLAKLAAIGGNSTRTWGAEEALAKLDEAQRAGLTVSVGLWLGQLSAFDYTDAKAVEEQREMVRTAVTRCKSHPALLMWGLGNEMELGGKQDSEVLWREVEHLAALIKTIDPDHPVMTVVAEINPEKIAAIKKWAPHVDVLGINTYGPALSLPKRLRETGWDRPYVVTEFGPLGWWEAPKTAWDAPLEPSSTTRYKDYTEIWQQAVAGDHRCLGGYAFAWGHKWEGTATWFGMFLPGTEERLSPVDAMATAWGHPPKNRVPEIHALHLNTVQAGVGTRLNAHVTAFDVDGDLLTYRWEVRAEKASDGKAEAPVISDTVPRIQGADIELVAPRSSGYYRLYVYASDGHGGAATANVPFRVVNP